MFKVIGGLSVMFKVMGGASVMLKVMEEGRQSGADPEGGARQPVFAPNSLKCPPNWPKYAKKLAPSHLSPLFFFLNWIRPCESCSR